MMTEDQKKLVVDNINLVHYVMRKHFSWVYPGSYDYEDLFQQGCEQLCKCAIKFDPQTGFSFSTYATNSIWGYITSYIRYDFNSCPGHRTRDGSRMEYLDVCSGNVEIENNKDRSRCELLDMIPDTGSTDSFDIFELKEIFRMAFEKASNMYGVDILDLLLLGHTQDEIATMIFGKSGARKQSNVSRTIKKAKAIFNSSCDLDLRYPEPEILKLHNAGISHTAIASILNVSKDFVRRTIDNKGENKNG